MTEREYEDEIARLRRRVKELEGEYGQVKEACDELEQKLEAERKKGNH